jgi:hypothetical protein
MSYTRATILTYYYFVFLVPSLAFAASPVVMIAVFATRSWRSLANPWGYIGVSILVLYVLAVGFVCLAFVLAVDSTTLGVGVNPPPPPIFARYEIPVSVYGSVVAFVACSIAFLRYLRSMWSKRTPWRSGS